MTQTIQSEIEAEKIGQVDGLGDIHTCHAPWHQQIEAFNRKRARVVSVEDAAKIRLAGVSDSYTRTSIAPIAIKGAPLILWKNTPLTGTLLARAVVSAHANGKYLEIPGIYDTVKEIAKQEDTLEPEDRTALAVSKEGDFELTPETPVAQFLLRTAVKPYFQEKTNGSIPFYGLSTDSKIGIVNYLWFNSPQVRSNLSCGIGNLDSDSSAFGVSETGEASAQNLWYNLTQIAKANSEVIPEILNQVKLAGIAEKIAGPLTRGLIAKLRKQ